MLLEKRRYVAKCYLATRPHPILGLLLKVGSSTNPQKRIQSLGAIPAQTIWMPFAHETDIHRHLRRYRAWPDDRTLWVDPVFTAHTEWFLWNANSRDVLNAFLALHAAKQKRGGTLADLNLDTEPDPERTE